MKGKKIIFSILAVIFIFSGCGVTFVRNLKPPIIQERPANVLPLAVAVPVSSDLLEHRAVISLLEGDTVYVFRSIPDFYVQSLTARFETVEVFPEGETIPKDRFDLIARMSIRTEERKLSWASAGLFMVLTLVMEDMKGNKLISKTIEAPRQVFSAIGGPMSDMALAEASEAMAKVFELFGKEIEASESLRRLGHRP